MAAFPSPYKGYFFDPEHGLSFFERKTDSLK